MKSLGRSSLGAFVRSSLGQKQCGGRDVDYAIWGRSTKQLFIVSKDDFSLVEQIDFTDIVPDNQYRGCGYDGDYLYFAWSGNAITGVRPNRILRIDITNHIIDQMVDDPYWTSASGTGTDDFTVSAGIDNKDSSVVFSGSQNIFPNAIYGIGKMNNDATFSGIQRFDFVNPSSTAAARIACINGWGDKIYYNDSLFGGTNTSNKVFLGNKADGTILDSFDTLPLGGGRAIQGITGDANKIATLNNNIGFHIYEWSVASPHALIRDSGALVFLVPDNYFLGGGVSR